MHRLTEEEEDEEEEEEEEEEKKRVGGVLHRRSGANLLGFNLLRD